WRWRGEKAAKRAVAVELVAGDMCSFELGR
ncbi:MAG: hypothetical protein ACI906_005258, partial [Candidatus Latescibacterota bacterium]